MTAGEITSRLRRGRLLEGSALAIMALLSPGTFQAQALEERSGGACAALDRPPAAGVTQGLPAGSEVKHQSGFLLPPDSMAFAVTLWGTHRDAVSVTASVGPRHWYCGLRSTGWGVSLDSQSVRQWNRLQRAAHWRTPLVNADLAWRVAITFLNFATGWAIDSVASEGDGAERHPSPKRSHAQLAVATATYRVGAGWAVNGLIGDVALFELTLDSAAVIVRYGFQRR